MALIPSAIHQFSAGCDVGDGVTNGMFFTQKVLRSFGVKSEIFSMNIPDALKGMIKDRSEYITNNEQVLMVHYAMGTDDWNWTSQQNDLKIMIYHNITPHDFFPEGSALRYYSQLGRKQLAESVPWFAGAIGVSEYNSLELTNASYHPVATIPLLIDLEKIVSASWDHTVASQYQGAFNLLFVGRIVEHKKQHELVELFAYFKKIFDQPAKLLLIGGTTSPSYQTRIRETIQYYHLNDDVELLGKVSNHQLYGHYRSADVFICLSEHEGFGMPLIEAMCFDVPVVALNTSNIGNTLGQSGILFNQKSLTEMATCLKLLAEQSELRRRLIRSQRNNLNRFRFNTVRAQLIKFFNDLNIRLDAVNGQENNDDCRVDYQIEGPFDSSYSLALVNRELAIALDQKNYKVALRSTEGSGDFSPNPAFLKANLEIERLWRNSSNPWRPDVVLRNTYPPRVNDTHGLTNILGSYGWEESAFPGEWIHAFNKRLDLVTTTSNYVTKTLIDNGLRKPCVTVGNGVDHILRVKPEPLNLQLKSGFRFLHVSSAFPRKGIDVLLDAWVKAFSSDDPVVLVIKTFPNPHNTVEAQVANLADTYPHHASIILINEDMPLGAMVSLYQECNALVAPSRGEGFGLPMAEAMLFGLPVIVTGYGGQTDFCTDQNAWLIDYSFAKAQTHMGLYDSVWAEPSANHLADLMRAVYLSPVEEIRKRTVVARDLISSQFTWDAVADRLILAVKALDKKPLFDSNPRIAWISTWNTKCGIATYSNYLVSQMNSSSIFIFANQSDHLTDHDESNVFRCWTMGSETNFDEVLALAKKLFISSIVIQFNFSFFNFRLEILEKLIENLHHEGIKIFLFLHSTADVVKSGYKISLRTITSALNKVDRILVHSIADLNQLKHFPVVNNVTLFPHGVHLPYPHEAYQQLALKKRTGLDNKRIIASYGFLLPHKGITHLISAFADLLTEFDDIHLLLVNAIYPVSESEEEQRKCERLIAELLIQSRVTMINDFLPDEESLTLLSLAECIVFPYQDTQESASGAIKQGLAAGKPIICSPLAIFDDVADAVLFLPGIAVNEIRQGIAEFLRQPKRLSLQIDRQRQWCEAHHWSLLAQRLWNMIVNIETTNP